MCVIRGPCLIEVDLCLGHGAFVGSQEIVAVFLPCVSNTCFGINQSGQLSRQREGVEMVLSIHVVRYNAQASLPTPFFPHPWSSGKINRAGREML